jgi:hypothetical protein
LIIPSLRFGPGLVPSRAPIWAAAREAPLNLLILHNKTNTPRAASWLRSNLRLYLTVFLKAKKTFFRGNFLQILACFELQYPRLTIIVLTRTGVYAKCTVS